MKIMVLALPGRSVPPQVDSDKLTNELHRCTESQKLDARLEHHITRVKSNSIYFCILCLYIILCDKKKKKRIRNLTFILKQSLILSSFFVIIVTRPIGDSYQDLIRFNNKRTK